MPPSPRARRRRAAHGGALSSATPAAYPRGLQPAVLPLLLLQALAVLLLLAGLPPRASAFCPGGGASRPRRGGGALAMRAGQGSPEDGDVSRRESLALGGSLAAVVGGLVAGSQPAQALRPPSPILPPPEPAERPFLWQVLMSDPPQMQPYTADGEKAVLRDLARTCNALFLGEHPESPQDHELQLRVLDSLQRYKPRDANLAVGLEMVQQRFQPALDAYVGRAVPEDAAAEQALREATEWDSRWGVPFELYLPLLRRARQERWTLLALGIDSEALAKVQQVGLEGLSEEERGVYVADPSGFIQSVTLPAFKLYAERYILPSYAARTAAAAAAAAAAASAAPAASTAGAGKAPPSAAKFLASRILWDESMATKAVRHLQERPRDLVVMLVGADHVKFGMGAPARVERLLRAAEVPLAPGRGKVRSVLLNPTPEDTGSQTRRLRLTLGYAASLDRCKPVADYLWYSQYPKVAWLEHPQNPISFPYSDQDILFQVFPDQR